MNITEIIELSWLSLLTMSVIWGQFRKPMIQMAKEVEKSIPLLQKPQLIQPAINKMEKLNKLYVTKSSEKQ